MEGAIRYRGGRQRLGIEGGRYLQMCRGAWSRGRRSTLNGVPVRMICNDGEPWVREDLRNGQSFCGFNLQNAREQLASF